MVKNAEIRQYLPFKSNFLEVGGHRLHYLDAGTGRPIVMLHGNPTWSFYFRTLVSAFSGKYRTIVPDHIGCGLSDKPQAHAYSYTLEQRVSDLEALLDRLDLKEKITLVVHDWGGMIGMTYAVRHPERIHRIVVLNTAGFFPPLGKKLPLRLRLLRNFPLLSKIAIQGGNLFARSALVMAPRKPLSKAVKEGLIAPYNSWKNRIATYRFVQDIPISPTDPSFGTVLRTSEGLSRLSELPMLIVWGKHDFVFDMDYYEEWRRRFPMAESHLLEDAGHYLLEDEPEKIIMLLEAFFTKTD